MALDLLRRRRGSGLRRRVLRGLTADAEVIGDFLRDTQDRHRTASGEFDVPAFLDDLFKHAPTADVQWLRSRGSDSRAFYEKEVAPNWTDLSQAQRAAKVEHFVRFANTVDSTTPQGEVPDQIADMVATVHLKVLVLAWAYDYTYSYVHRVFGDPSQFGLYDLPPAPAPAPPPAGASDAAGARLARS